MMMKQLKSNIVFNEQEDGKVFDINKHLESMLDHDNNSTTIKKDNPKDNEIDQVLLYASTNKC